MADTEKSQKHVQNWWAGQSSPMTALKLKWCPSLKAYSPSLVHPFFFFLSHYLTLIFPVCLIFSHNHPHRYLWLGDLVMALWPLRESKDTFTLPPTYLYSLKNNDCAPREYWGSTRSQVLQNLFLFMPFMPWMMTKNLDFPEAAASSSSLTVCRCHDCKRHSCCS